MRNAKQEFLQHIEKLSVKCAIITSPKTVVLKLHHTKEEFDTFLEKIDFKYDGGYGEQELYGIIWYWNDTWSSRGEYDGSEWWEHNELPEIDKECM